MPFRRPSASGQRANNSGGAGAGSPRAAEQGADVPWGAPRPGATKLGGSQEVWGAGLWGTRAVGHSSYWNIYAVGAPKPRGDPNCGVTQTTGRRTMGIPKPLGAPTHRRTISWAAGTRAMGTARCRGPRAAWGHEPWDKPSSVPGHPIGFARGREAAGAGAAGDVQAPGLELGNATRSPAVPPSTGAAPWGMGTGRDGARQPLPPPVPSCPVAQPSPLSR